jgi:hypothetical protein
VSTGPLGLGPVPAALDGRRLLVRQPVAIATGAFLLIVFGTMIVAVLIDPGDVGGAGEHAFWDRWVLGAVPVPALYGIWRFLLRPRIVVDDAGVILDNAFSSVTLPWADIADARGGSAIEVVGTDGDCARAMIYGPTFSGPLTRETRPRALVALIRTEAARRAGHEAPPEDYTATPLVADVEFDAVTFTPPEPVIHPRTSLGLEGLAGILVGWTVACAIAAMLS